jgi:hypothetical protein
MANLVKTNLFCRNKEDFNELLILLIQYGVLSQKVTMEALDMETCSISFCSKWDVPFNEIRAISKAVDFDFYIEHAGQTVVDGVGEAVYHNGEVIDGADFYDDDSLDIAKIFLRINGQDCYRYDKTSGVIVFIEGENVDDVPDLAVIDTTSEILENFLSRKAGVRYQRNCNKMSIEEWMILISEIFNIEQDWFIGDIQGTYISDGYMDSFGLKHFKKQVENEIAAYIKKEGCTDGYYSPFKATESSNKQCAKPFVLVSNKNKTVTFLSKKELADLILKEKEILLDKYQDFLKEDMVTIVGRNVFFVEGTVESILRHRPDYTFLLNGKKDKGWNFLANLPKETLDRKTKMYFAPDVDEDYDAEIFLPK